MSTPTPIRGHVADIIVTARDYHYEATAAHTDGDSLHATVRRFKVFDGERRYYGLPKAVVWPLRGLRVAWMTDGTDRKAVAA